MKRVIWIIIIVLIVLCIFGGFYLYNLLNNNKYDLKNISDSQKKEIIELLNCTEISNDIELNEMQVPKAYRDIYYQIYFETNNKDIKKYIIASNIYGRDLKELKDNNYCCTIYRKDDKSIDILEKNINKNSDTASLNDLDNKEKNNENSSEIKIQYNVEFGIINSTEDNALTLGYYINDESSLRTISLTDDIKVIDFETEKEINYNEIKRGDYVYINIPTEYNNNKQTIISVAKKEYIEKKATEILIGKKKFDTGIVYYNNKENYVIANIEIEEKAINNLWSNASYYMKFNILPTTEIYLARTESLKEKSDILLNEMCWMIVDADMISNLNNNYNATTIEFFGD